MASSEALTEYEIVDFLRGLRTYRAGLSGQHKLLLDTMVSAALGRRPGQECKDGVALYWRAYAANSHSGTDGLSGSHDSDTSSWDTTPWGLAFGARGRYSVPRGNGRDWR